MTNKAPFISFEGGEGSGKSTQIKLLSEWLQKQGLSVYATREPGGTEGGKQIRALVVEGDKDRWTPETETLLYMADRCQHIQTVIKPKTEQGIWVLSDRFVDSTYAYQSYARGLPLEMVQGVYDSFARGFAPNLTLLLDIDPVVGLDRAAKGRGRNLNEMRFESIGLEFHKKIRAGYLDLAAKNPQRYAVVKIEESMTPEQIHAQVVEHVAKRFSL